VKFGKPEMVSINFEISVKKPTQSYKKYKCNDDVSKNPGQKPNIISVHPGLRYSPSSYRNIKPKFT